MRFWKKKLRGETFTYLSLYCSWFYRSKTSSKTTHKYLEHATEDDRLERWVFMGKTRGFTYIQALSNADSYSGFVQLGVTACGGDNIDFTLMYINEGATWHLRLLGLEDWVYGMRQTKITKEKIRSAKNYSVLRNTKWWSLYSSVTFPSGVK